MHMKRDFKTWLMGGNPGYWGGFLVIEVDVPNSVTSLNRAPP